MNRIPYLAVALAIAVGLSSVAARAQSRVFVSTAGSDSNPCSVTAPCRTFAVAYNAVAANGEIDVLTPGGYGGLTIEKALSIQGHGFSGISVASAGTGITINAPSTDAVSLNGLLIEGSHAGNYGILFNSGKSLTVENCVIRNLTLSGLDFVSNATTLQTLAVSNSYFSDSVDGILIAADSSGAITASIDRTGLYGNSGDGLFVQGSSGTGALTVAVTDSVAANNGTGFDATSAASHSVTNLSLTHTLAEGNNFGVSAYGMNATLWLALSTLTGNATSYITDGAGVINSYQDNYAAAANGAPIGSLTPVGKQ